MSNNSEEEKQVDVGSKTYPLDLAAGNIAAAKPGEVKPPLILPQGPPLRSIRLVPQATPAASGAAPTAGATIIATNIVPTGTIIKQGDANRAQITGIINTQPQPQVSGNITFQRQITLQTSLPVVAQSAPTGTTYHVPRGPAVVASLAAPRSNVTGGTIRTPLVVTAQGTAQGTSFVRPTRTPSPAQCATTWISSTTNANGSQVKGVPAVLTSAARATTITTGKSTPVVAKQQVGQIVSTIKPTTLLQSAIIGQGQLHQFKNTVSGIQTINTTVAVAQVVPARTQTLVYSAGAGNATQFASAPRITVATTAPRVQATPTTRPMAQVTAARLAVPVTVGTTRLLAPQGAVLTPASRITAIPSTQPSATPARIISTQSNVALGRLTVSVTNASNTVANPLLTQIRSTLVHSVLPTTNVVSANRGQSTNAKIITQAAPGAAAIHLTSMPAATLKTSAPVAVTTTARTITPQTTIVTQRPAAIVSSHTIPITKVYQHQEGQPTNVYQLHAQPSHSTIMRSSPAPTIPQPAPVAVPTTTIASYSFYDSTGAGNFPPRTYAPGGTTITAISQATTPLRPNMVGTTTGTNPGTAAPIPQSHGVVNPPMRYNPIMVVEQNRGFAPLQQQQQQSQQEIDNGQNLQSKLTSPRPSILRKREHDGSPLKAAKNLMSSLSNVQQNISAPLSPPSRPDSRNNGHSSGGSTTISATSSPGLADGNDDSNQHMPMNKDEEENRPPLEMSPRKKPRKQNLAGNDLDENIDDMQFLSERELKREQQEDSDCMNSDGPQDGAPELRRIPSIRKPASASLLNSYKQTWKTTNNHYLRYSDVRPKDERRPTIIDLSNQHRVMEKVNGWKIHHLSTQMEDLAEQEHMVHSQLNEILKFTETQNLNNPDINRVTELIKGNMQRVKIIKDGMVEAKTAVMKIFDHKVHVTDIISRCASKRNYKKREKT